MDEPRTVCFFKHEVDPNETGFDLDIHHICPICAIKLLDLAQQELEFEIRGQTVELRIIKTDSGAEKPI